MKTCTNCNQLKNKIEFHRSSKRKDSLQPWCKLCIKQRHTVNKDKISTYNRQYWVEYKDLNRDKILRQQKEYNHLNKSKVNAKASKRRALKLKAMPSWLDKEQLDQIQEFYEISIAFRIYTGQEYHVDHIIPLKGENVCGLHVPWNLQVITAEENLRKSNKYE